MRDLRKRMWRRATRLLLVPSGHVQSDGRAFRISVKASLRGTNGPLQGARVRGGERLYRPAWRPAKSPIIVANMPARSVLIGPE
jgi:hypothetical protein